MSFLNIPCHYQIRIISMNYLIGGLSLFFIIILGNQHWFFLHLIMSKIFDCCRN